jgi:hypothetical protein
VGHFRKIQRAFAMSGYNASLSPNPDPVFAEEESRKISGPKLADQGKPREEVSNHFVRAIIPPRDGLRILKPDWQHGFNPNRRSARRSTGIAAE